MAGTLSDRQKRYVERYHKKLSEKEMARRLNVHRDAVRGYIRSMKKDRPSPTTAMQKVLLVLFGLLLLGLVELGLRAIGYGRASEREDPFVGFEKVYPLYGKKKRSDGRVVYRTNENKLRFFNYQEFPEEKPEGTFRIFCFGGSTTYGRPYTAPTAFSRWLEISLNGMDPSRRYEVINAGGISYASYRIVNLVEEMVGYHPDLFVLYSGHNEFLERRTYRKILEANPVLTRIRVILNKSRIYTLLREGLLRVKGEKMDVQKSLMKDEVDAVLDHIGGLELYKKDEEQKRSTLEHYRYNLEQIVRIARDHDIEVILTNLVSNIRDFSSFKSVHSADLNAEGRIRWDQYYNQGMEQYKSGAIEEALEAFQEALKIDGQYAELYYWIGKCYDALGQYDQAKAHYITAKNLDIAPLRALSEMNGIIEEVGRKYRVPVIDLLSVFEARSEHRLLGDEWFLDHMHPTIEGHQLIADEIVKVLVKKGTVTPSSEWNYRKKRTLYDRAMRSLDRKYYAMRSLNLGKVLLWSGKSREALGPLEEGAKVLTDNPEIYRLLARAYADQGDEERAVAAYQAALKINPDYAEAHNNLGVAYAMQGQYDKAIAEHRAALRVNPNNPDAYNNLGNVFTKIGQYENAIAAYQAALKIEPNIPAVYHNLGTIYAALDQREKALMAYQTALQANPDYPKAYLGLGDLYGRMGEYNRAIDAYQRALKINPDYAAAYNGLGIVYGDLGEYDKAIEAYQAALKINPKYADAYHSLGFFYTKMGHYENAIPAYETALKLDPGMIQAYGNLGLAYLNQGDRSKAKAMFEKVLKLNPGDNRAQRYLRQLQTP